MKIGMILSFPPNDHRAVFYDGIARELVKMGHEVEVIMQKGQKQFEDVPYKLILVPGSSHSIIGQIKFIIHVIKEIRKKKYDIIQARNPFSSLIPALLVRRTAKVVYDIRGLWAEFGVIAGYYPKLLGKILDFIDICLAKMCHGIIAISPVMKRILMEKGVHKKYIEIIPEGVDLEKFSKIEAINVRDIYGTKGRLIGYVGSISTSRGSEKLIEIFRSVKNRVDDAYLIMVGPIRKEEKEYFNQLIKKLNLKGSVIFTGFIEKHLDIPRYIKSFDVAVSYHPSRNEIYEVMVPIKILEYMASGVPVVATDNLAHRNIIKDHINGILANVDDYPIKIINILNDIKTRRKISRNSKIAVSKFSFRVLARKVSKFYEKVLKSSKSFEVEYHEDRY